MVKMWCVWWKMETWCVTERLGQRGGANEGVTRGGEEIL